MILKELLQNDLFLAAAISWTASQVVKVLYYSIKAGGFKTDFITSSGGFPSSHTATMTGLTAMAAASCGLSSPAFAICFFISMVVIYDALGVRAETGNQATILNELKEKHPELFEDAEKYSFNEKTGHTTTEVIAGFIVGIVTVIILSLIL